LRAAGQWLEADKDESYLLQGSRLAQYEGGAANSRIGLTDMEHRFLAESVASREDKRAEEEARRQQELETARKRAETEKARAETESLSAEEQEGAARRLRRFALLLVGVLVVAVVLAFLALRFGQQAESLALISQSRELAAANNNLEVDPELSLLLGMEALGIEHTIEAEAALHQALVSSRLRQRFKEHAGWIERVAYSPDGSKLALMARESQAVSIWDVVDGRFLATSGGDTSVRV
jgi:hypothetical protein